MAQDLVNLLADLKEQEALEITQQRLASNEDPNAILSDARQGMAIVGERFASGVFFIPDLIYSGEILRQVTDLVKPRLLQSTDVQHKDKLVLGTVAGDIHDIGLNIVDFMLDTNGFEVHNLGVDVPASKFVEKIKETNVNIVGLSGFLTLAFDSMKETVKAIEEAGLRDKVKIMIGGGQIDDQVRSYTGADAYGKDAMEAVSLAKKWVGAK
ncbi:B12-binding domain-containing protein [Chloroflexota bacterium]